MKTYPPEDFFHGTQLSLAQAIYDGNLDVVVSLSRNTDLNKPGNQDMTLLFYALQAASDEKAQQLKIMSVLVKQGADPLQRVPDMGSVAGVAARSTSPEYIKALLDGGMSPKVIVRDSPLIFGAAADNSLATLALLVERGADVNERDSVGRTVLFEALAGFQLNTVNWLLDHGGDPTVKTNNGDSFSSVLTFLYSKEGRSQGDDHKLDEIAKKAVSKGMKWAPQKY
ncbi:ankyrin repeat domain-containing protein [Erwinia tasmaniensis]|uniref:Lipoprotein n=1 Tax=Erwinia tasmaniensis (strain DSM 17950 / CFBP 7177 / CIP 109463 / NCPPB 4357 / Et1/99) TaxID=465817 RepID=B2VH56_ERWT9|nr:ankyrin repeat domain-containing protein [Erwinia tasmaniensis]CAO95690.1 Putative lipoprotein [Erwinia tasmaniensis Et1/99]